MRRLWIGAVLAAAVLATGAQAGLHFGSVTKMIKEAKKEVKTIEAKKLYNMIQDDEDLYILDIREPDQLAHGEIFHLNLVAITRGYLEFKVEKEIEDKNATVVIYCCTGKRGMLAAKTLQELGYKRVFSLEGGIRKWVEEGYPLDTVYGEMTIKED